MQESAGEKHTCKSVLVTGGASGIGLAIATAFVAQGHRVMLADINDKVPQVAESLSRGLVKVHGHVADLSREDDVLKTAATAASVLNGCDILVNCAGILPMRDGRMIPATDVTTSDWQRVMAINLTAPFILCRELIPGMQERAFGRIINIASKTGRTYTPFMAIDYATSKAGLIGMTRQLGGAFARWGITVNAIAPGRIETPLVNFSKEERSAAAAKLIPAAREGTVQEVAAAALFLASEGAAYITGACLDVNGGSFMG